MELVEDRVKRGAEWLDGEMPGWERKIDLDMLRLDSPCNCILGQLFDGDFGAVVPGRKQAWAQNCGFLSYSFEATVSMREYDALEESWIKVIQERKGTHGIYRNY